MARIRTIKPEIWEDQKVGKLDALTALTFIGLVSLADDEGRGRADPVFIRSRLHPYRTCTVEDIEHSLTSIGQACLATFYAVNGQDYYFIPKFLSHQVINKPKPSRLPPPPVPVPDPSGSGPVGARAEGKGIRMESESESEGSRREGNGEGDLNPVENVKVVENPPGSSLQAPTGLSRMGKAPLRGKALADAKAAAKRLLGTEP